MMTRTYADLLALADQAQPTTAAPSAEDGQVAEPHKAILELLQLEKFINITKNLIIKL